MYTENENRYRALYKEILRLRLSEEKLTELYKAQEMRTPTHFGTGQEAIAVGVCQALANDDVVYSHHRCHNHYLAKGGSFFKLTAELYGREAGCSNGRGGSVHLTARDQGFIISSAILAQTIAVATGSALAFKMDNNKNVAVTFFGDGACEEGACYESLNYAAINKLPVLYVCENNLYSTESTVKIRQPEGTSLAERAAAFMVPSETIDGNNVFTVFETVQALLPQIRKGGGPFFLECMTYRWREHVGPNFDYEAGGRTYRTEEEQKYWIQNKCPLKQAEQLLFEKNLVTHDEIVHWKQELQAEIDLSVIHAKESAWPNIADMYANVD
ncbi:MAG: thiamine pyrophosphate-dependent dehydrogenase E1 component subunit alpha [Legionellaceae bacterium]|nr:thiamine pyrophosphate-dependent dehydrogenase E1 component subunit alpha [Legionellaceae bacterium]